MYGVPGLAWYEFYAEAADALTVLTLAAAVTDTARLGTSVLVAPLYSSLHLARALATIDQASGGRVIAGLGSGWSRDEYRGMGADFPHRGRSLDETIDACRALWTAGATTYSDSRMTVDNAFVNPKPASTIPMMLGGYGGRAFRRISTKADGWLPADVPPAEMKEMWSKLCDLVTENGRDAGAMELIPRANVVLTEAPTGTDRQQFTGTWDQITEDAVALADAGADELLVDMGPSSRSGKEQIDKSLEALNRLKAAGLGNITRSA
jgi:probable F420-dependent oxidoreductase